MSIYYYPGAGGLQVLSGTPSGDAGLAISNNFKKIATRVQSYRKNGAGTIATDATGGHIVGYLYSAVNGYASIISPYNSYAYSTPVSGSFAGGLAKSPGYYGTALIQSGGYGGIGKYGYGCFAFGYVNNVADSGTTTIKSYGYGSFAFGSATGGGSILSSGAGSFAIGSSTSATTTISATAANSFQFGVGVNGTTDSLQVGSISSASLSGIMLNGGSGILSNVKKAVGGGTETLSNTGTGSLASGYLQSTVAGKTAGITASGVGSLATGNVRVLGGTGTNGGFVKATNNASIAFGSIHNPSSTSVSYVTSSGQASMAFGHIYKGGLIRSLGQGSLAFGAIYQGGTTVTPIPKGITSGTTGALTGSWAFGFISGSSASIYAKSRGSIAAGTAAAGGAIYTTAIGAMSFGYTKNTGLITSTAVGSLSFGYTKTAATSITASGKGSLALGYASAAITASADNAFQFGPGTNAEAISLQVGSGIRIFSAVPGTPKNGDIWLNSNYVYIRSNGNSVKVVGCAS